MTRFAVTAPVGSTLDAIELTMQEGRIRLRTTAVSAPQEDLDAVALTERLLTTRPLATGWQAAGGQPQVVELRAGGRAIVQRLIGDGERHGIRVVNTSDAGLVIVDVDSPEPVSDDDLPTVAEHASRVEATALEEIVTVALSDDELAVIAGMAGLDRFPGASGGGPLERDRRRRAQQSLVARDYLRPEGDRLALDRGPGAVLTAAVNAIVTLHVEYATRERRERRLFHLAAGFALEHAPGPLDTHRFTVFATDALIRRLSAFLQMGARSAAPGPALTLTPSAFDRLHAAATRGALNGETSTSPHSAAPFLDGLRSYRSTARIRVARRDGERVTGGELAWLDTDANGLWEVVRSPQAVRISPTGPTAVLGALRALWA
jgi:hypothetical protein